MPTMTVGEDLVLAFDTVGEGSPLLLIHGITENRRAWDPLVPELAASHTVIRVDLPGHGESDRETSYDVGRLAADTAGLVAGLGVDDPLVIGHSLGGMVATAYAAAHPCRAVVNIDQPLALAGFQEGLRSLEPALRGAPADCETAVLAVLGSMAGQLTGAAWDRMDQLRHIDQDVILGIWSPVLELPGEALEQLVRDIGAAVRVPYLALHGIDPGPGYDAWLGQIITGSRVELWPGVGHYPHLVNPDRFLERIAAFEAAL